MAENSDKQPCAFAERTDAKFAKVVIFLESKNFPLQGSYIKGDCTC